MEMDNYSVVLLNSSDGMLPNYDYTVLEWAEILYYGLILVIGAPLNLCGFVHSIRQYQKRFSNCNRNRTSFRPTAASDLTLLTLHLNLSDLLTIFVYVPSMIGWHLTIYWWGGNWLCKLVRFSHQFCFHLSSNVIVCIATERLLTIAHSSAPLRTKRSVKRLLAVAWLLALVCSLPSLFVWRTFSPWNSDVTQCTTNFQVEQFLQGHLSQMATYLYYAYNIGSTVTVFWIPAGYISIAYGYIFFKLRSIGLGTDPVGRRRPRTGTGRRTTVSDNPERLESQANSVEASPSQVMSGRLNPSQAVSHPCQFSSYSPFSPRSRRGRALSSAVPKWRRKFRSKEVIFSHSGLYVLVYLISWLPYFLSALLLGNLRILSTLIAFNAAIDPIIYAFRLR